MHVKQRRTIQVLMMILLGLTALQAKDPVNPIPNGATIFIEPNEGFEQYLRAAFQEKGVPLTIVLDKEKAEFVMSTPCVCAAAVSFGNFGNWTTSDGSREMSSIRQIRGEIASW